MKRFEQKRILAILLVIVMVLAGTGMATAKPANAGNGNSWKTTADDADGENAAMAANNGRAVGKTRNDAKAQALYDLDLFEGISNEKLVAALDSDATRLQAITMIGRALKWDEEEGFRTNTTPLPADVQAFLAKGPTEAYRIEMANHVRYALAHGVTLGIGKNQFGVDMPINARMMYTWYARALMYEENVWENPEALVRLGMMTQEQLSVMNWDEPANRDALVGVMYNSMNWKFRGTNMKLVQRMIKNMWIDYKAAVRAGLMDPEETEMSYVVRQSDYDKLQLTFSHVLDKTAAENEANYAIRVRHHPYGAPVPETVSGGAIVTTPGAITVEDIIIDPEDYTAELSTDGNDVVLTFDDDFLVHDRVYVTPTQNVVSRFGGYTLDEDRDTRLIVIR